MTDDALFDVRPAPDGRVVRLRPRHPGALVLDAGRLDALIEELLTLRAAMAPPHDLRDPGTAGQRIRSVPAQRLYVSRMDAQTVHVMLGHPGLGWVGLPVAAAEWERLHGVVTAPPQAG